MFPIASVSIIKDGRLLMVKEGKKENHERWNIPSGRPEEGETISDCAVRETLEETGYNVQLKGLTGIYCFKSETGTPLIRFNFIGEIKSGEVKINANEILSVEWFSFEQIAFLNDNEIWNAISIRRIVNDLKQGNIYPIGILK
jgi:ADP-ribose pyrophosphatase YjhB (NUDIX family)